MQDLMISDLSFQLYLQQELLMGSQCTHCGKKFLPPRPICPDCRKSEMEWIEFEGFGKLAAFTCITVVPPSMVAEGFSRKNPYCCGVVELTDGVRVDARIVGIDPKSPENIKIGMPMVATYIHHEMPGQKRTVLGFQPD